MKRITGWCLLVKNNDEKNDPIAMCYGINTDVGSNGEFGLVPGSVISLPRWIKTLKHLQGIYDSPVTGYNIYHDYKEYEVIILGIMEYNEISRLLNLISKKTLDDLTEIGAFITTSYMEDERTASFQLTIELLSKTVERLKSENAEFTKNINLLEPAQAICDGNCEVCVSE